MADSTDVQQLTARVYGRVQGVGFRAFTQRRAGQLGLSGWVRNEPDGSVRVVAEGPRSTLRQFLDYLHQGPGVGRVERVETDWSAPDGGFASFKVRY